MSAGAVLDAADPAGVLAQPLPLQRSRIRRALASLRRLDPPHLMAMALVLGAATSRLGSVIDPDIWWHLRVGRYVLRHHALPAHDTWSIATSGHPWVTHEWLSETFLAAIYDTFGYRALAFYRAAGVLALLGLLAMQAFRRTTPYRALGVTALAVFATLGGWGERPQLLSFILLVPAGLIARRAAAGRLPWQLVPLTWLWANLHGLWFLGIVLVASATAGAFIDSRGSAVRHAARSLMLCAASVLAAALTPNGPAVLLAPLRVHNYAGFVSEWGPTSIHDVYGLAFFALLGVLGTAIARRREPVAWAALLPMLIAGFLGVAYIRTIAPAVVILVPYLAETLRPRCRWSTGQPRALNAALCCSIVVAAAAGAAVIVRDTPVIPPHAPVAATRVLETLPGPQRVINEYAIGGWLIWKAPNAKPAIDGRAELYDPQYMANYFAALRMSGQHWQKTVDSLRPTTALLNVNTPLVVGLSRIMHWKTIYRDDTWVLLVPPHAASDGGRRP